MDGAKSTSGFAALQVGLVCKWAARQATRRAVWLPGGAWGEWRGTHGVGSRGGVAWAQGDGGAVTSAAVWLSGRSAVPPSAVQSDSGRGQGTRGD